jgi:hypothetical protein
MSCGSALVRGSSAPIRWTGRAPGPNRRTMGSFRVGA